MFNGTQAGNPKKHTVRYSVFLRSPFLRKLVNAVLIPEYDGCAGDAGDEGCDGAGVQIPAEDDDVEDIVRVGPSPAPGHNIERVYHQVDEEKVVHCMFDKIYNNLVIIVLKRTVTHFNNPEILLTHPGTNRSRHFSLLL